MDILGQTSLLVAVTSFALGLSVLARNVRNKLFLAFAVLTSLVAGWALFFFLEKIWGGGGFYQWHLFLNLWITPAALHFIRMMIRIQDRMSRRLQDLAMLLALVLSITLLFPFGSLGAWARQLTYFLPVFIVLQILELMWIDRRLRRGLKRIPKLPTVGLGRRNLIYLGGLLVLCTCVMDHVPGIGTIIPSIGNLALTIYLFFISQAISQQRLLNFGALVSRFLVLLAVALTLTGIYWILFAWIQNNPALFFLNSFIVSFLLLMLLEPIRSMVTYLTQRLLTQKHLRLQQTLREAQRKLAGILDPPSLFHTILITTEQTLQPQWAALYAQGIDGTRFRRVLTVGESSGPEPVLRQILVNHPLLQQCEKQHTRGELPILLDQILENEIDRSASRTQRESLSALIQGLKALGSNLLIPLFDSGKILGFVTLHAPTPPEPWGNNWGLLPVVYPYFEQAAQSMRNMGVYARQREKERLAALGEMAAGLAHEIRNPLGAIKGAAQYLDPSSERPESKFLRVIVEETDRLNRVVTQFLDYSKPPTVDLKTVDLGLLVEKTLDLMRPSLDPFLELRFESPKVLVNVLASAEQIRQVLINLLQNSVKALEGRGERWIRVAIESDTRLPEGEVSLIVEDSGAGIKKENLDKLFIPFFTTSPSGTGLGLSISQKIIEAHRGRIEVATEEGRFTRFTVILPKTE